MPETEATDASPPAAEDAIARAWAVVAAVVDPEIPVLTLADLGVLRGIEIKGGELIVELSPTYTGCPATLAIRLSVEAALTAAGLPRARVVTRLSPAWSSDDISEEGRRKLKDFGIAPPLKGTGRRALFADPEVACPPRGSRAPRQLARFRPTH